MPRAPEKLEEARALPLFAPSVETSEHFGERFAGELRLTQSSWQSYAQGRILPEGTQIAFLLRSPEDSFDPSAPVTQVLWMEKTSGGAWTFLGAPSDGSPLWTGETCARCHAEAPVDFTFRIGTDDSAGNAAAR